MYGIIDIGSNSVRLGVTDGENTIKKILETTRLGEGLHETGRLSEEAQKRSVAAIERFRTEACALGADKVFAFATEAVRKAENGRSFAREVERVTGVPVEILAGEKEAEIGLMGAVSGACGAVLDVGGASTELAVKTGDGFCKRSLPLGCVVLKNACGEDEILLEKMAAEALQKSDFPESLPGIPLYGIGGTATTLAAFALSMEEYDPDKVTGTVISADKAWELYQKIAALSVKERLESGIPAGRADIIAGGAYWIAQLLRRLGNHAMIVSDRDNIEGYAKLLAARSGAAEKSGGALRNGATEADRTTGGAEKGGAKVAGMVSGSAETVGVGTMTGRGKEGL